MNILLVLSFTVRTAAVVEAVRDAPEKIQLLSDGGYQYNTAVRGDFTTGEIGLDASRRDLVGDLTNDFR